MRRSVFIMPLTLFACCSALQAQNTAITATGVVVQENADFEGAYAPVASSSDAPTQKAQIGGVIAPGWQDNSNWADVGVEYSKDAVNPHRGQAAQKIQISRVSSGAVQFVQNVSFKKGRVHLWSVWLRGNPGTGVNLSLRKAGAPYTEYASQTASLSAEWQEFRVFGAIPEDTEGFLMVRATQPMTFWVDDSTLQDLTTAQSDAPVRQGNLLPTGGSFEAGIPYGWSVRFEGPTENRFADPRPRIDRTDAKVGRASLRCDIAPGDSAQIRSPLFTSNYNRQHTVSLWMKAAQPQTNVQIALDKDVLDQWVQVGPQWQCYSFSTKIPFQPYSRLRILAQQTAQPNTVWLDGAMIEEKPEASPEYSSPFPVEMALSLANPGHVVFDRERASVNLSTAGQLPRGAQLKLAMTDLGKKILSSSTVTLPATSFALPQLNNRRGMWKMRAQIVDAQSRPLSAPAELIWARLPRPRDIDAKNSYFGTHIQLSPYYIAMARAIGVRRVRLHDTSMLGKWPIAETAPGQFRFYDEGVTAAHNAGLRILGMLDGAPTWTSTKPREGGYWGIWNIPDKPDALPQWERYVSTVAGHYKGRIDDWEIWNEPWGEWFRGAGGSPELFGQLIKTAYTAAKQANPNAYVIGVDTYRGYDEWTNAVLSNAGPQNFDGFSFHDYNDALYGGPQTVPQDNATHFIAVQKAYGTPKPLWNTEGGLFGVGSWYAPETGGMGATIQPAYIVRYDVTYMAAGARAFFLYAIHTDGAMGDIETRTNEHDRAVKPILAARAVLASLVDGSGQPQRSEPVKGVDQYTYPRDVKQGRTVAVLWSYDGAPRSVTVPRGVRVLDVWGNVVAPQAGKVTLTPEPIYWLR
ncbi:MAG TPA: hypothetical protein VF600_13550 [Abditibacteriaceae bacterium]|jgi:hypothetical protein